MGLTLLQPDAKNPAPSDQSESAGYSILGEGVAYLSQQKEEKACSIRFYFKRFDSAVQDDNETEGYKGMQSMI